MEKHYVVQDIETRFLTRLEKHAEPLRHDFPRIEVEVWSGAVGSLTDFQGHNLGIDCTIPDTPIDRPHNIALIIEVMHLAAEPKLCGAIVCWGHPSGTIEAELIKDDPLPYNESTIAIVEERLDELVAALREALRRGRPTDWPDT